MNPSDFVLFSYDFNKNGGGALLTGADIQKKLKAKSLAWVHLDALHDDTSQWLHENLDYLDPVIIQALLAEETRPRITYFENGAMVILRGMNLHDNAKPEDMISIRLWIDESRIISVQRRSLKAINDMRQFIEDGKGPSDAGSFLGMLCQRIFERMQPVLFDLSEEMDDIEEELIDDLNPEIRHKASDIRKKSLIFKRYLNPQKDVMLSLRNADIKWIKDNHLRVFQENQDRLMRYLEDLDTLRERAQIMKEEYVTMQSDRMNKNTYALSLIAGIFLPLGFLTGLLGINVGGMPGVDNPLAFWYVCAACILCGLGFVGLFKLLKWL